MMEMLISELVALANDPRAWLAVAGLAMVTVHGLWSYHRCPLVNNTANISPEAARNAVNSAHFNNMRFLALMVLGIGLAISGMVMIAMGTRPALALGLIAGGLFLVQTEPLRLNIRDRQMRVIASEVDSPDAKLGAISRLRNEHKKLLLTNVALTVAVAIYLLAL